MRRAVWMLFLPTLALTGCHGGLDKKTVGVWASPRGMRVTVAEGGSYQTATGRITSSGAWRIEGDDVVFTPATLNGRPVADLRGRLAQRIGSLSAVRRPLAEKILHDLDLPNYETLSGDGKSLTTDRAKDTNTTPWPTLTKG
jgi:hypothetical protein